MRVNRVSKTDQKHNSYSFVYGKTFQDILDKEVKKLKKGESIETTKETNKVTKNCLYK